MIYKDSIEAQELSLYAVNDGRIYDYVITPVIASLRKKAVRGAYDGDKAIDAFYHVADQAARIYARDFGHRFTVQQRFSAAVDMLVAFDEEIHE